MRPATRPAKDAGPDEGDDAEAGADAGDGGPPVGVARFPVKNIVFILKESRTFDLYFGKFPGANGATTANTCDGGTAPLQPMLDVMPGLDQTWNAARVALNDGGMNCFELEQGNNVPQYPGDAGPLQFQVADSTDIPNYWKLAQTFVLSDNFYASALGDSFANHLYAIAGTSAGAFWAPSFTDPLPPAAPKVTACTSDTICPQPGVNGLEPDDIPPVTGQQFVWGCDSDPQLTAQAYDGGPGESKIYPCFDVPTSGRHARRPPA